MCHPCARGTPVRMVAMASYSLNEAAVDHARRLIDAHAAGWRHKTIELAAHELLQLLDGQHA